MNHKSFQVFFSIECDKRSSFATIPGLAIQTGLTYSINTTLNGFYNYTQCPDGYVDIARGWNIFSMLSNPRFIPKIISSVPNNRSMAVAPNTPVLQITLNKGIKKGTGYIELVEVK